MPWAALSWAAFSSAAFLRAASSAAFCFAAASARALASAAALAFASAMAASRARSSARLRAISSSAACRLRASSTEMFWAAASAVISRSFSAAMSEASAWAASALADRAVAGLLGPGGQPDLLGLGAPGLALEDLRQRVRGGEPLVVGLQRGRGALEGDVLVHHALRAVGAHHRVERVQVAAVLVGLRDQRADPVPLRGDGTTGVRGVRTGLAVGLLGLLEVPHGAVVGLGGLLGPEVGGVQPLVGHQQPGLDGAHVVRLLLRARLGPVDLVLARERSRRRTRPRRPGRRWRRGRRRARAPGRWSDRGWPAGRRGGWPCAVHVARVEPFVRPSSRFPSARRAGSAGGGPGAEPPTFSDRPPPGESTRVGLPRER